VGVRLSSNRILMMAVNALRVTLRAKTAHDDVGKAHVKTALLPDSLLNRREKVIIKIDALATSATYYVMVMTGLGVVIDGVVAEAAAIHTSQVFKQLKSAIDSGLVHAFNTGFNVLNYLFRCKMPISFVNDIENHPPLRRQSIPITLESDTTSHATATCRNHAQAQDICQRSEVGP